MSNVVNMFPSNDFSSVCQSAGEKIETGLIIGYDEEGYLLAFGGGLIDGRELVSSDLLWLVESFKNNLISGVYMEEED